MRHVDVQQQDFRIEGAHGFQQQAGVLQCLHQHLRVAQHQAVACRQVGIVVDDHDAERRTQMAVEAALQAAFQLGDVQRTEEVTLGAGTHGREQAVEVGSIADHQ